MSTDKGMRMLIVEDDLALQKQIKWSLDAFESVTAEDRESALNQLRRHSPAVVTMDLGLPPDQDGTTEGFRLLDQMLEIDGDVKVIVLTGQNDLRETRLDNIARQSRMNYVGGLLSWQFTSLAKQKC